MNENNDISTRAASRRKQKFSFSIHGGVAMFDTRLECPREVMTAATLGSFNPLRVFVERVGVLQRTFLFYSGGERTAKKSVEKKDDWES